MSEEYDESSLYEGVIDVFPQDYTSDTFSETDSGKLQVLVKLLAAIHELNSSERQVWKKGRREVMGVTFWMLICFSNAWGCNIQNKGIAAVCRGAKLIYAL